MESSDPGIALYTAEQARALDAAAMESGVPGIELMQRAARAALAALGVCVLCGPGNNGGDGFLLAAFAREAGLQASVIAIGDASRGDAARARAMCEQAGVSIGRGAELLQADVYVDALFGSGLNRAPDGETARLIGALNAKRTVVLALDVPSGLSSDTGVAFAPCVRADATVCFVAWKRGLFTAQGPDQAGACELATLGLRESLYAA